MKYLSWVATVLFLCPLSLKAQVTCSPNVDRKVCTDAASILNSVVDHGAYRGVAVQVEIVLLLSNSVKSFSRFSYSAGVTIASDCVFGEAPSNFSKCYRRVLWNSMYPDITFLRDKPTRPGVSEILISSSEFNGVESVRKPGSESESVVQKTDRYDRSTTFDTSAFIAGYLSGTISTSMDGSFEVDLGAVEQATPAVETSGNGMQRTGIDPQVILFTLQTFQSLSSIDQYLVEAFCARNPQGTAAVPPKAPVHAVGCQSLAAALKK